MSGLVRRRRALGVLVTACFVCTGAGVGAALVVKSPAQAAADTAPPPASVLTAPVEQRVISQSLITRGEVTASQHVDVSAGPQADKDIGRSVVTKADADPGQEISAGQVLLEVSGRPLFVLKGAVPAYRDLARGKRGQDVAQAQAALRAAGHPTGADPSGVFGAGTEKAVASFYRSIGYEAPSVEAPGMGAASSGPVLPISEVVFVRSFPARVDELRAKVGDEAGEGLMSLSAGALTVEASVTLQQKGMIRPGQEVRVHSETTGRQFTGTVTSVGKETDPAKDGGQDTGAEKYTVKVRPSKPLPSELNGENVQVTVVAASSKGKVLAVPSSAVSTGADGLTSVTERKDGRERRIPVTVGVSGDGFVQVTPREGTRLEAGAEVVVGVQPRAAVGGP
ncbi:HlyD family efflux transporter periplasmic adaptor subunit [Streptomyces sp. YU58]|uniref:HlyD family efflux transporter periplasmic adaptor subunit n=1 Tax=Streptomyces sp. SX92 TaxID=3158972 RepID=UPI0027BAB475|nr:HlyD family efflux transporter periplasmic adaptor subunit [Streptomyces coralus]WLW52271.1 HlyD family efflux transporter periplasmic adaptor subunit [Streptomyces coralus]